MEARLEARKREETGKGGARRTRANGEVPGVIYGLGTKSQPLAVKAEDLEGVIRGEAGVNVLIDLHLVDGKDKSGSLVMIKELQKHPLKDKLLHVDFLRVARDEVITARVQIAILGEEECIGLKAGGTLQHALWEVEVECLPADIPDQLTIDISGLDIGDNLRVEDLQVPKGVELMADPDDVIATILAPRMEEELVEEEVPEEELEFVEGEEVPEGEAPEEAVPPAEEEEG